MTVVDDFVAGFCVLCMSQSGTMGVALMNSSPLNITVNVTLSRDGCALLNCSNSNGCSNGICQCKQFVVNNTAFGFVGTECKDLDCPGQPDCFGRGVCVKAGDRPQCQCNANYNGMQCENTEGADMSLDFATTNLAPVSTSLLVVQNTMYNTSKTGRVVAGRAIRKYLPVRSQFTALFTLTQPMALVVRLETSSPDADPLLLSRSTQSPTLTDYDELDLLSWTSEAANHTLASSVVPAGPYYITVMNTRYASGPLNFTLYYEFATLCPPSLTFAPNASNATAGVGAAVISLPRTSRQACSGNGDPYSYCSNGDPLAVPPSSPSLCSCLPGWEGLYCDVPAPVLLPNTTVTVSQLQPGQWQYFVFTAPAEIVELTVNATQISESLRAVPLVMVGRTPARTPAALGSVYESSLFDFDSYTNRRLTQVTWQYAVS
jgi:hypothetical protein